MNNPFDRQFRQYLVNCGSGALRRQARTYMNEFPHLIGYHAFVQMAYDHCERHGWELRVLHNGDFVWDLYWLWSHPAGVTVQGCAFHFWMAYESGETLDELFPLDKT